MGFAERSSLSVSVNTIKRLLSIFISKKWHLNPISEDIDGYEQVFNQLCELLSLLDAEEQELILCLMEDFLHIPYQSYPLLMKKVLSEIDVSLIESCDQIFILPLATFKEAGKVKSSGAMLYSCTHLVIPNLPLFKGKKTKAYQNPALLKSNHPNRKKSLLLLLDDFVGSGTTAEKVNRYYKEELLVEDDTILIVSLVAQEKGILEMMERDIEVLTVHLINRGISDSVKINRKMSALKTMRKIEKRLKIDRDYRLGFKRSQALVSMIRAPNNTFPVFWCAEGVDGNEWPAPFRR